MAAKILIKRKVRTESLGDLLELYVRLRSMAMRQPGYVSGETLISAERDDVHLVISTWRTLDDWMAWEKNPERIEISEQIDRFLAEPPVVRAFTNMWGSAAP